MEHVEYLYLLGQAHRIHRYEEEAREAGGVFHATGAFHPIDGVMAQLRIVRVFPADAEPKLVLRIRHKVATSLPELTAVSERVAKVASAFLGTDFFRVPTALRIDPDQLEHVFSSTVIPPDPLANPPKP